MSAPLCPVHGVPMRPSKYGGFYCTQENSPGDYCAEKIAGPKPVKAAPSPAPLPVGASVATGSQQAANTMLMAAALYFCTITGQGVEHALTVYQTLKKAAV